MTALYGSVLAEIEEEIAGKASAIDPLAIEERDLPWLASWLSVDLDPDASLGVRRQAIVDAFRNDEWRGTPQGIQVTNEEAGAPLFEPADRVSLHNNDYRA